MTELRILERYRSIIDDWPAFAEACRRPLPVCIWTNTSRIPPQDLSRRFGKAGIAHQAVSWHPGAFRLQTTDNLGSRLEYLAGLYQVQEEVAMLPAVLLRAQPGQEVLDLCAAPGNKTAQLSGMMHNTGTLVANDSHSGRIRAIKRIVDRLGLLNVSITNFDGGSFPRQPFLFDAVLVDVPCTCEGTCRKNPEVLNTGNPQPEKMIRTQTALLKRALQLCRVGGRVVYATCTFAPEENEMVVQAALSEVRSSIEAEIVEPEMPPLRHSPGLASWQGETFRSDMQNAIRIYPHHNDTGGFFVAVIEKCSDRRQPWRQTLSGSVDEDDKTMLPVTEAEFFVQLQRRFGLVAEDFRDLRVTAYNRKTASVVSADHRTVVTARRVFTGLPFMKLNLTFPKLTTAAAMAFGARVKKHVVHLRAAQADAYFHNRRFSVTEPQVEGYEEDGYCVLQYDGFSLGTGLIFREEGRFRVVSQYPKAWQFKNSKTAFD